LALSAALEFASVGALLLLEPSVPVIALCAAECYVQAVLWYVLRLQLCYRRGGGAQPRPLNPPVQACSVVCAVHTPVPEIVLFSVML